MTARDSSTGNGRPPIRTDRRRPVPGANRLAPYRLLIEGGADVFSRHDRAGRFLDASPAATTVLGRSPRDLLGRSWPELVQAADRDRFEGWWRGVQAGATAILPFHVVRPDGSLVRVETAACAGLLVDEHTFEVQAVTREAPVVHETAESLTRRCRELEYRLAQFERAHQDLRRFAADTAHDLRAPLQVISGFAQLVARRHSATLDEPSQQALATIMAASADMADLIDGALESAVSAVGQVRPTTVDCGDAARRACHRLEEEIEATGALVEIQALPVVSGDRAQLGRVFQNLLSNAIKAGRPGSPVHVVVSGNRCAGGWQITVRDDGIGVARSDLERIFETYERPRPGATGGSGLGLGICRSIVEAHGGLIGVESVPAGGSRFTFFLPDPAAAGKPPGTA